MIGKKENKAWLGDTFCLITAAIWGTGFIASQMAIDAHMSAALIMVLRFSIAAIIMAAVCLPKLKKLNRRVLKAGLIPGLALFGAFFTQILGQQRTTVSHSAFLTATNVVIVPFLVWIFSHKRPPLRTFCITLLTLAGVSVLSIQPGSFQLDFQLGDMLTLICAVLFAFHLTSIDAAVKEEDVMLINLVQLAIAALISAVVFFITDTDALKQANLSAGLPAVCYLGVFSTCLCYFLQTLAQKYTSPTQAGVLLSTEGLFGTGLSIIMGLEPLTLNTIFGGLMILTSVILLEYFSGKAEKAVEDTKLPVCEQS